MSDDTSIRHETGTMPLTGRIRVDGRLRHLTTRLEEGEIAVIDEADLNRHDAHALAAKHPLAVLNAQPSTTGRHRALGPKLLLEAGIAVIDDLGQDIMSLREGDDVTIDADSVSRDGIVAAQGHRLALTDLDRSEEEERRAISTRIGSFAASIDDYLAQDGPLVLDGVGAPSFERLLANKTALLVLDDNASRDQIKRLRSWINDAAPVIIGVDGGADIALKARLTPALVVGDMDQMSESVLRRAKQRVVCQGHDGIAPGKERLDRMGLGCEVIEMSGTAQDAAIVVATHSDATAIVTVGAREGLNEFVDRGRSSMSPSFFSRLVAGERLIAAPAVWSTHRPRISSLWMILFALVVVCSMIAGLWATPWGNDLLSSWGSWVVGLVTDPSVAESESA